MKKSLFVSCLTVAVFAASAAQASSIIYRPMNPHISPGAFPSNELSITNTANLSKPKNTGVGNSGASRLSTAEQLKSATISSLSSQLSAKLLDTDVTAAGTINFGDGVYADYTTSPEGIRTIIFRDTVKGTSTEISFSII